MPLNHKPIRVLVVDDSAFMRSALTNMLHESPEFTVVGAARNGEEALEKVATLKPDVMTLDIDMPGMNGLRVLERVMATTPLPVVVVSALTEEGADVTIQALNLGAVDFLPKQLQGSLLRITAIRHLLHEKVRTAVKARVEACLRNPSRLAPLRGTLANGYAAASTRIQKGAPPAGHWSQHVPAVIAIGCSTGGPQALQEILPLLPASFPAPIVIAQHMPKYFTKPFADRLNQQCAIEVREATASDVLTPGVALLAPGGQHMVLESGAGQTIGLRFFNGCEELPYRPSVDVLMQSLARVCGAKSVGVILTGMGHDGMEGARAIKAVKGVVLAQDEASSVVYGMPKAVIEEGYADKVIPLSRMAEELLALVRHRYDRGGSPPSRADDQSRGQVTLSSIAL
ncbi:MAG: chemotaxis response regulator protein-glutamate methylesterase [Nitrospirae bacterium]|nr:MAG: chemotaxis response regulator protein-glutamate methylesterase [Nitrospirota bacterium]